MASLAPDGRTLLLTMPDGTQQLSTIDGGPGRAVTGLRPDDRRISWSRDGRAIFVQSGLGSPAVVERVELDSGQRRPAGKVGPAGLGSVALVSMVEWSDEGDSYVYNYTSLPSTLFVVSGATK